MFSCYRYTHVSGDMANQYPRLAWYFEANGSMLSFKVARCSPEDQFSYTEAKKILDNRVPYVTVYQPDLSLVENAIRSLSEYPGQFERMVVEDHYIIRCINADFDRWMEHVALKQRNTGV